MALHRVIILFTILVLVNTKVLKKDYEVKESIDDGVKNIDDVFNGVYTECFTKFSYTCIQKKTLTYLKQLNNLSEVPVVGDYVKFVRLNTTKLEKTNETEERTEEKDSEELTHMIDKAIDSFFDNHVVKFNALGRDFAIPKNVEEFVGRKKRKGGGGGGDMLGGHDSGHFGHKKMMMMAMMCMKMKMMMMLPAMMGMMGMMSFKGMMFSMMSFMISKMMLLMKILEKKGGAGGLGGGGGGGSDGGWAASGGSGGAWMPAGGQDFGGGGGYDANGQWQSRSIFENKEEIIENKPVISYVAPVVTYSNPNKLYKKAKNKDKSVLTNEEVKTLRKSRKKRSIIDALRNSYTYWMKQLLGFNNKNRRTSNIPKYKIINGVKYVFYPYRQQKYYKPAKETQNNRIKNNHEEPTVITAEDFNKGEIVEGAVESRMNTKKIMKIKDTVSDTLDDNPWE
ncbi:unnamed protein product [Arctia plantaginis]|uniref:Uncharacterized protein n=1 Tax=Arctia plantaginis TaxID=874455 RepID=A0A8S0YT54_ARCPL|nr:unnamed protein product [Arctia plantaginis]